MQARALVAGVSVVLCYCAAASCGGSSSGAGTSQVQNNATAGNTSTSSSAGNSPTYSSAGANSASGSTSSASGGASASLPPGPQLNLSEAGASDQTDSTGVPAGNVCGKMCPTGVTCSPEVCDRVDNNCDGVVDNVDVNGDGICDCLLVATLGAPGTWGQGDVFATWLAARSNNGATALADQVLTADLLNKYEVIVAQDVHLNHMYSDAEVQALQAWVKGGGGFMTLIGYSTPGEEANVNRLLMPYGMSYGDMQILPKGRGATTVPITMWVPHPIDQGVTAVGVDQGLPVQGTGTVIATGGGYNIGLAQDLSPGHVFVWGDEWITYNSEWQQHPDYQVELFWVNALKWLTTPAMCQVPVPAVFPK